MTPALAAPAALVIGAHRHLDAALPGRPGVTPTLHRLAARLAEGGLAVRALLDDAATDAERPLGANLLATLSAPPPLQIWSGAVRDGCFLPRDALLAHLGRTGLPLAEVWAAVPPGAVVVLDLPLADAEVPHLPHAALVAVAATDDAPARGPSALLRALLGTLAAGGNPDTAELARRLTEVGARVALHQPRPLLPNALAPLPPRPCRACGGEVADGTAAFCPTCGAALSLPERLDDGRYVLLHPIGAGGMGQVWLAEDTRLKARRAIKLLSLPPRLPPGAATQLRKRLLLEARAAQAVSERSPGVVRVYDVGHCAERDEPYLVMELLEGETLGALLARGRPPLPVALALCHAVTEALAAVHALKCVHRDLKPDNIMLCGLPAALGGLPAALGGLPAALGGLPAALGGLPAALGGLPAALGGLPSSTEGAASPTPEALAAAILVPGAVKLIDFGLVKMDQLEVRTASGHMMGTPQYMPPEQLRGGTIDARADVFSLGAVLYECLSGVRANPGNTQSEIFKVLLDAGPAPLATVAPDLDGTLCAWIDRCLALAPQLRPADAAEVLRLLTTHTRQPIAEVQGGLGGMAANRASGGPEDAPVSVAAATLPLDTPAPFAPAPPVAAAPRPPAPFASAPPVAAEPDDLPIHGRRHGPLIALALLLVAATAAALILSGPRSGPDAPADAGLRVTVRPVAAPLDAGLPRAAASVPGAAPDAQAPDAQAPDAQTPDTSPPDAEPPDPQPPTAPPLPEGRRVVLRGLGALRVPADGLPVFERARCGDTRPGDRLRAASWTLPGYDAGRCAGSACATALPRALQAAAAVAETLRLKLVLQRPGPGAGSAGSGSAGDEVGEGGAPDALAARDEDVAVDCLVRP